MFKTPDKHLPREWGEQAKRTSPWDIAVALGIVLAIFGLGFVPYGYEIGLGGVAFAVMLWRRAT